MNLLLLVLLLLAHLLAACTGSLVSLLFAVQHGIGAVALLAHRPARQASLRAWDMALGWTGTLLPLAMRATDEPAGWLSLTILASGSLLASGGILSLGRSCGMASAYRRLQSRGFYRVARHPIDAAYLPHHRRVSHRASFA